MQTDVFCSPAYLVAKKLDAAVKMENAAPQNIPRIHNRKHKNIKWWYKKFFHIPDGSILYTKEKIDDNIIKLLTRDEDRKTPTNENEFLLNESLLNKLDNK